MSDHTDARFGKGAGIYQAVWMIAIALGVIPALIHIPIHDRKPAAVAQPQES